MPPQNPPNAENVQRVVEDRLNALDSQSGLQETVTIEWRGGTKTVPVITMPTDLLFYNPDTHRVRAQRSMDPVLDEELKATPYSAAAQGYLHTLLMGDPSDPTKVDPSFIALKDDLKDHGQREPGLISRTGVLVNGNTRQAALKSLGFEHIRVGVLPADTSHDDLQSIELSLQLRRDHRREYSFMNFLLAVDERAAAGQPVQKIMDVFHIKETTYERARWILEYVRDAISRSAHIDQNGKTVAALSLVNFEAHQGKLEELYRAWAALKITDPNQADALREQRLLALLLDKSKTDLRLIEPDFIAKYMKSALPASSGEKPTGVKIPGTSITVPGPSAEVVALRRLTTAALQAKSATLNLKSTTSEEGEKANSLLAELNSSLGKALDQAGKQVRLQKRKFAPADRLSDACDDLELTITAVAEAKGTANFDPADLDEALLTLRSLLNKLSAIVSRGSASTSEGVSWLQAAANIGIEND